MLSTKTQGPPECSDIATDKAEYKVTVEILGSMPTVIFSEQISAGSAAHAALMGGVVLYGRVQQFITTLDDTVAFTHNIKDHTRVTVTKV